MVTPAPPAEVWAALTRPERLSDWFGAEVEIDARLGGRATFRWADGRERVAVVEVLETERLLVLRWLPFEHDGSGRPHQIPATEVRFEVREHADGTLVKVSEGTRSFEMQGAAR